MTPNVSRLLQRWGVDKEIGRNLFTVEELNLRRKDGRRVGHAWPDHMQNATKYPWWVVHRHHLLTGLLETARKAGCDFRTGSRVVSVDHKSQLGNQVQVATIKSEEFEFDFLVGADGLNSIVRQTLFPLVKQRPLTNNASYRATIPYSEIESDPALAGIADKKAMNVWMGGNGYIIGYPISGGDIFNLVLSHHRPEPMWEPEEADFRDVRAEYFDYDKRILKIMEKIPDKIKRWPLLQTGPLDSWSSPSKNVVIMGDAAHSMVNHLAQGAATSMEDGAFLAICIAEVIRGRLSLSNAVDMYEAGRMPMSRMKQQMSFLNGAIWMLPEGVQADARDTAMQAEVRGEPYVRSPNLMADPSSVLEVFGYDPEGHAREIVEEFQTGGIIRADDKAKGRIIDTLSGVEKWRVDRTMNWFLADSEKEWRPIRSGGAEVRTKKSSPKAQL